MLGFEAGEIVVGPTATTDEGMAVEAPGDNVSEASSVSGDLQVVSQVDDLDDLSVQQLNWLANPSDRWVVNPNRPLRVLWDITALAVILIECVTVPLMLCFLIQLPEEWHWISTSFFICDICLNYTTGYFSGSLLIMKRSWIAGHYVRTWFWLDLVSTFPWDVLAGSQKSQRGGQANLLRIGKLGKLARVLRLLRIAKLIPLLKRMEGVSGLISSYNMNLCLSITSMTVTFGIVCHWAACVWGWLGDAANVGHPSSSLDPHDVRDCTMGGPCEAGIEGSPWRRRYGLDNYDLGTQYLAALQFATGLITGGEMLLQPGYTLERVYTIVMMILGVFVCSSVVSSVLMIMSRESELSLQFEEQMQRVRDFMTARNVPLELQAKIRRYLEGQFKMQRGQAGGDREFMGTLSHWLQTELTEHLNQTVMVRHPFFKNMPAQIIRRICLEATPLLYAPGDVVVEKGHIAVSSLFIVRGKLRVVNAIGHHSVYLTPPQWMGDRCLFMDAYRTHTVMAVTPSEVLCLQKSSLLSVCHELPLMDACYRRFQERILKGDESSLRCAICGNPGHVADDCPQQTNDDAKARRVRAPSDSGMACTLSQMQLGMLSVSSAMSQMRRWLRVY